MRTTRDPWSSPRLKTRVSNRLSGKDEPKRARLASFDDFTLNVTSPIDDALIRSDSAADVNVNMTSSVTNFKNYSDGAKLIEFKSSNKVYSDNMSIQNSGEDISESTSVSSSVRLQIPSMSGTSLNSEPETWLAPFQDYDLDVDSGGKEMLTTPNEGMKSDAERFQFTSAMSPRDKLYDAAVKVHAVVKFTRLQRLRKRVRWFTKKFIVFVLSHVGLTSLVGLYAVAGAFIFQRLEKNFGFVNTEPAQAFTSVAVQRNLSLMSLKTFQVIRHQHVDELWNMTLNLNVLQPVEWKEFADKELRMFEENIYQVEAILEITEDHSPGRATDTSLTEAHTPQKPTGWTYPSALLFAVTVITTIGYGDTVPKSWEAKIVCIVYATFGIPLTLLCLANIGSLLASVYRVTWKHASHLSLIIVRAPERNKPLVETSQVRVPISVSVTTMVVYILGGAAIFSEWENWTFLEGSYFCFITLSTIGFGDYVPGKDTETLDHNAKRVVCALYLLFGLALLSMIFQLIQDSVTIVVGRYASFLGLSEAQIEKDILECKVEELEDKDVKNVVEINDKGAMEQLARDQLDIEGNAGVLYPIPVSEMGDRNALLNRLRARSLPVHGAKRKHVSRLHSVLEESVSRRNSSFCPDDNLGSLERTQEIDDEENARNDLCRKYSLPAFAASKDSLEG